MLYGLFTDFTDNIRVCGQRFLYRHRIQLFLLCVLASSSYANLPIALTIVHFDGTPIHSLHSSKLFALSFRSSEDCEALTSSIVGRSSSTRQSCVSGPYSLSRVIIYNRC